MDNKYPLRLHIIKPSGAIDEDEIFNESDELPKLQSAMEGTIELWPMDVQYEGLNCQAWVNEDARVAQMPYNQRGARILGAPVYGNVVILIGGAVS